jgi:hypothetical protein
VMVLAADWGMAAVPLRVPRGRSDPAIDDIISPLCRFLLFLHYAAYYRSKRGRAAWDFVILLDPPRWEFQRLLAAS